MFALSFPYLECYFLGKGFVEGRREYYKLLIGWRIVGNGDTMLFEDAADAGSHSDGMARYLEIELIRKQRIKLDAEHSALGKQGSMTLHVGEEFMWKCFGFS